MKLRFKLLLALSLTLNIALIAGIVSVLSLASSYGRSYAEQHEARIEQMLTELRAAAGDKPLPVLEVSHYAKSHEWASYRAEESRAYLDVYRLDRGRLHVFVVNDNIVGSYLQTDALKDEIDWIIHDSEGIAEFRRVRDLDVN